MTYRDVVLYDDLRRQDYWFPMANLMTHGIIKGNLQRLGSVEEPLEKFTDDVLLYFARGISMYELYISPDLLTEGEWNAISEAMLWARDRFPILRRTEMIGGDPGKRQPYGYVHWGGTRGILAARNPWVERAALTMRFDAADGLDANTADLVLEQVYPTRWISPKLYKYGEVTDIPLEGFETAIYEVYPLQEASGPLVAGIRFDERDLEDGRHATTMFEGKPSLLNPHAVSAISVEGRPGMNLENVRRVLAPPRPLLSAGVKTISGGAIVKLNVDPTVHAATVALLIRPDATFAGAVLPRFSLRLDGKPLDTAGEEVKGAWAWYRATTKGGAHRVELMLPDSVRWKGTVSAWILSTQYAKGIDIIWTATKTGKPTPMPPRPWAPEEVHRTLPIGECVVER